MRRWPAQPITQAAEHLLPRRCVQVVRRQRPVHRRTVGGMPADIGHHHLWVSFYYKTCCHQMLQQAGHGPPCIPALCFLQAGCAQSCVNPSHHGGPLGRVLQGQYGHCADGGQDDAIGQRTTLAFRFWIKGGKQGIHKVCDILLYGDGTGPCPLTYIGSGQQPGNLFNPGPDKGLAAFLRCLRGRPGHTGPYFC